MRWMTFAFGVLVGWLLGRSSAPWPLDQDDTGQGERYAELQAQLSAARADVSRLEARLKQAGSPAAAQSRPGAAQDSGAGPAFLTGTSDVGSASAPTEDLYAGIGGADPGEAGPMVTLDDIRSRAGGAEPYDDAWGGTSQAETIEAPRPEATEGDTHAAGTRATPEGSAAVDDLALLEGIGPKIANLLKQHGVRTFRDLASTDASHLYEILAAGGPNYRMARPETWPEQARLAADGAWSELKELQSRLRGGSIRAE